MTTRLLEQFPRDRDAPGADLPGVTRVEGSQRYLSARLSGSVMAVYSHRKGSVEELAQHYRAALESGGYTRRFPSPERGPFADDLSPPGHSDAIRVRVLLGPVRYRVTEA